MNPFANRTLRWLDMQGYHLSDQEKRQLSLPIRFAPALCALFGAIFLIPESPPGLLLIATTAFAGAVLPRHPFDYLYALTLARVLRTGLAPTNTPQRRFACALGAVFFGSSALLFTANNDRLAWFVGLFVVVVATVVATTNWCLPSFIYNQLLVRLGFPTGAPS